MSLATPTPVVGTVTERLSTGVDALDRQLNDGLFPGSIVAVCAPPDSQSEPLLHATMRERPTQYVSTRRGEAAVRDALERALEGNDTDLSEVDLAVVGPTDPHEDIMEAVDVPEGGAVIIDTMDPIEHAATDDELADFLNDLKEAVVEADGLALLHCSSDDEDVDLRHLTESLADVIWDLSVERNGSEVETVLEVPKYRGDDLPGEAIKLEMGSEVSVDTSRDIA